jgi:hypothetical protein
MKYSFKWTQPYRLDYSYQTMYNQNESIIETLLETSMMLDAKAIIDRIKQL